MSKTRWIRTWLGLAWVRAVSLMVPDWYTVGVERVTRDETRRRLVGRLRARPSALWLLDYCIVSDCRIGGGLEVLGDHAMVVSNWFDDGNLAG